VDSDLEAVLVAADLVTEVLDCSYCCDNGVDDHGITCNSGIIPPAKYLISGAATSAAGILATVAMVVVARFGAI
jgi:hypothetical protein